MILLRVSFPGIPLGITRSLRIMQVRLFCFFIAGATGLLALSACSEKADESGGPAGESPERDPGPLHLNLSDELIDLQVRGESPGRLGPEILRMLEMTPLETLRPVVTDDPEEWTSETRSRMAGDALRRLFSGDEPAILTEDFACSDLCPVRLDERDYYGGLRVLRPGPQDEPVEKTKHRGWEGFAAVRAGLLGEDHADTASRMSIKVVAVEELDTGFSAEVMVELRGGRGPADTPRQITTSWHTRWTREDPARLALLRRKHYEESRGDPEKGFVDVGAAVLGRLPHYRKQILRGVGDWAARVTRLGDFSLTGHHGLAVGDVNGDGLEDLYVCDGGSLPNRLYLQQEDGTVVDGSAEAGVDWLEDSRSALLVDLDNDGDEDLVVATIAMVIFLENDGMGRFSLRGGHPGARYPFSLSAADFDSDGLLDIHVCVYSAGDDAERRGFEVNAPRPFHDAGNGGRNVLLKNIGDFGFADATAAVGLDAGNSRWSFAAAWEDYDRDGDPDLYVANDFGRNCLYRNEGGRFRQIADELKIEDMASGMSVAWGDYNRDGRSDIYVGNMFSAAGNRVSRQKLFSAGSDPVLVGKLRRMARGNSLFAGGRGDRGHGFRDVSEGSRSHLGQWAWSSGFGDLNNDGWEDLVISNGFLTGREPDDL